MHCKKKILIAGASGLVGTNLQRRLKELNISTIPTKFNSTSEEHSLYTTYDFRNYDDCLNATKAIDTMVLVAGEFHGSNIRGIKANDVIFNNLKIIGGLLSAAAQNNISQVIFLSSATVYQESDKPIPEEYLDLNELPSKNYLGVATMFRYMEKMATIYALDRKSKLVIFRPNIYGPWDNFDLNRARIIPTIIRKTFDNSDLISLVKSTDVIRDFVFVDDMVNDIVSEIQDEVFPDGEAINIGSGNQGVSIKDLAELILNIQNIPLSHLTWNDNEFTSKNYRVNNIDKYLKIKSLNDLTSLNTGLQKTISWYKNFHHNANSLNIL